MKFKKFVKSIGAEGVMYTREDGSMWLSSGSIFMRVPEDVRTVAVSETAEMPMAISRILDHDYHAISCDLIEAVMPVPDGAIKDCLRIYATDGLLDKIAVCNDGYALIERGDITELFNGKTGGFANELSALLVKKPVSPMTTELEVVGLILPTAIN